MGFVWISNTFGSKLLIQKRLGAQQKAEHFFRFETFELNMGSGTLNFRENLKYDPFKGFIEQHVRNIVNIVCLLKNSTTSNLAKKAKKGDDLKL